MQGRSGDEGVNAETLGNFQRFGRADYVAGNGARESAGNGPAERPCDRLHAFEVARGRNRETRLDDVDAEVLERQGDLKLLLHGKTLSKRLFAVTQRRIKNHHALGGYIVDHLRAPGMRVEKRRFVRR